MTDLSLRQSHSGLAVKFVNGYLVAFSLVLAGYALFGKGFAYLGVGQLYIGEMALVVGCVAALATGCLGKIMQSGPAIALLLLACWGGVCMFPYVSVYGIDTFRDAVIVFYSAFSFIIASILIQKFDRLSYLIAYYNRFVPFLVMMLAGSSAYFGVIGRDDFDVVSQAQFSIGFKPGDALVQTTGILLFVTLGFRRLGWFLSCCVLMTVVICASLSRGGFISLAIALALAFWFMKDAPSVRRVFGRISVALAAICVLLVSFDIDIPSTRESRNISARQIITNLITIVSSGDDGQVGDTQGTKEFRQEWWSTIARYTLSGPYFWTGKGFGVNLADSDGFQLVDRNSDVPVLRSPHNATMTILARTGVPGTILWLVALGTWFIVMVRTTMQSRAAGDIIWYRFFAFLVSWWLAFLVNASFDVALEGPMAGIWFWTLHGIGIAAVTIYRSGRCRPALGDQRGKA